MRQLLCLAVCLQQFIVPNRNPHYSLLWLAPVFLVLSINTVSAASDSTGAPGHEEHSAHTFHPNHFALFVGATHGGEESGQGREKAALTLGLDYERRLSERWGVGLLGDWAFGDRREYVLAVPAFLHIKNSARFMLAPGYERTRGEGARQAESEFLIRVGFGWAFHRGANTITPEFNVDFVHGEVLVIAGVAVGWGF